MTFPTKQDKELYQKDVRELISITRNSNSFILFNDPDFIEIRKNLGKKENFVAKKFITFDSEEET